VPDIVSQFGGERVGPLGDTEYGTVFVVTPGKTKVERIEVGTKR